MIDCITCSDFLFQIVVDAIDMHGPGNKIHYIHVTVREDQAVNLTAKVFTLDRKYLLNIENLKVKHVRTYVRTYVRKSLKAQNLN